MNSRWGRSLALLGLLAALLTVTGCVSSGRAQASYLGGDYHPRHSGGLSSQVGDHGA